MITKVYRVKRTNDLDECLLECSNILKNNGLVAFPTETVYGLGANGFSHSAVEKLYIAKKRPVIKPISLCVESLAMAEEVAVFNNKARKLFDAFLPGPLTIVLPKKSSVPDIVSANLDTVGIRVPSNQIAKRLLKLCGIPIALPSANISDEGALTDGKDVINALLGKVDAIIDAGRTTVGVESTIVSLVDEPKIIRHGAISEQELMTYLL